MLKSGNKAAYFSLLREGLGVALKPVDALLQGREKRLLQKGLTSDLPLVLILGGSRSGTTLFYQTLAQYLPFSYWNNLSVSFPRTPITSGKLFNRFLRKKKGDFKNYYGSVAGFNGPNDGFHIWNRWLGEDRNTIPADIGEDTLGEIRNFVHTWHTTFEKPLLNKNNRNSLCVELFAHALDHVKFVEIRRDPVYVVQSLILSRLEVQGSKEIAWGLASKDSDTSEDPYKYVDDICDQVYAVEQELNEARKHVAPEHYLKVTYEDFCAQPQVVLDSVSQMVFGQGVDPASLEGLKPFKNTNRQRVEDEEFARIQARIATLYGTSAIQGA